MLVLVNYIVRNYLVLLLLEMVLIYVFVYIIVFVLSDLYIIYFVGWKKIYNDIMGVLKVGVYNFIGKEWYFYSDFVFNNSFIKFF